MQKNVSALAFVLVVGCVDTSDPIESTEVETSGLTQWQVQPGGDYDFVSLNTSRDPALGGACIDAAGARPPSGTPWWAQQFVCNGGLNQNFRLARQAGNWDNWTIRPAANDGYCLDVPSSNYVTNQRLQFYPCNGQSNQTFTFIWSSNTQMSIRPLNSSLCVDVENGTADAQASLQLYTCHYGPDQTWMVRKVVKRDELSASAPVRFYDYSGSPSTVTVSAGEVKSFIMPGGRVAAYGAGVNAYVCDTGNYDTNRVVVDRRNGSQIKVSCLHQ